MKLKYNYNVNKRKIVIELSTEDFTATESKALNMLGEPVVNFQKTYPGGFTLSLSKKISAQVAHVRIVIDGTDNIEKANEAGLAFIEDIKEVLIEEMDKLMDVFVAQHFPDKEEIVISNYVINEAKKPESPKTDYICPHPFPYRL